MAAMEHRSPGRPGALRGTGIGRGRPARAQVRADERLIEALRSGSLDRSGRLTDRLTRLLVRWRREVLDDTVV